jgi:hypothetical protein
MTEFEKGYEQGYKDGMAGAALPNVNDNGDKIDGYDYAYKTDSRGKPYIHIDSVRSMLKKAADVKPINQWISIEESKPKDMQQVLAVVDGDVREAFYNAGCFIGSNFYRSINEVKWWQPLPEPPKED